MRWHSKLLGARNKCSERYWESKSASTSWLRERKLYRSARKYWTEKSCKHLQEMKYPCTRCLKRLGRVTMKRSIVMLICHDWKSLKTERFTRGRSILLISFLPDRTVTKIRHLTISIPHLQDIKSKVVWRNSMIMIGDGWSCCNRKTFKEGRARS